ncbi:MAG: glycosyltransferase [Pseudomonadota bacterium]
MRVAVVTALFNPKLEWLKRCCDSVRAQSHPCTQILVSDGSGENPLDDFSGQFIRLYQNHNDWGDTPRTIGAISAGAQGYDGILWLDQDNWMYPDHVSSLVALHRQTGKPICTTSRDIYHLNGRLLGACKETDGVRFVDANCFFVTRAAYGMLAVWSLMPKAWHICSDMYFFAQVKKHGIETAHQACSTMGYTATRSHTYRLFGVEPPPGVKDSAEIVRFLREQGAIR